jgi:dCMP deaminase
MSKKKIPPRTVPTRDEYYLGKAFWIACKSKDPRTQVGAVIIAADNDPISTGYNGPPKRINDSAINWDRPDKYPFIIHAEDNAIKRAKKKQAVLLGSTLYVTGPPCRACMLDIVEAEIARVVFFRPKLEPGSMLNDDSEWKITQEIAQLGQVRLEEFQGNLNWMRDRIPWMESIGVFG